MPKRSVSIRRKVTADLLVIVLVLSVAILSVMIFTIRRAMTKLSGDIIDRTIAQTRQELDGFFLPVVSELRLCREWGRRGQLNLDDPDALAAMLAPMAEQFTQVNSIQLADHETGREFMLLRRGDAWSYRVTWPDRAGYPRFARRDGDAFRPTNAPPAPSVDYATYDSRTRPWHVGAVQRREDVLAATGPAPRGARLHWTEPYVFFTTRQPGITVSSAFAAPDGRIFVLGIDILLDDVTAFTSSLRVSEHGGVAVLTDGGQVIGLPPGVADSPARRMELLLRRPDEIGLPTMVALRSALDERAGSDRAVRFDVGGETWWGARTSHELAPGRRLHILVTVPESDLLGEVRATRPIVAVICLVVLVWAMWRAWRLGRDFARPIEALVEQSDRIARGDLSPGEVPHSDVREIRRLTAAQDHMREALGELIRLEGDLALARRIQQDTFPKRTPELPGFQVHMLSEPADQTGGDTYDIIGVARDDAGQPRLTSTEPAEGAFLLLADATGHGIGPALSVTQVRAMLRMALRLRPELASIASHMNDQLCADLTQGRFVTAWLGEIDAAAGTLRSFSAGQGPLLRYAAADDSFEVLGSDIAPFGVVGGLAFDLPEPIPMSAGDLFAVISDGVYEAVGPNGEPFGEQRVMDALRAHRNATPAEMLSALWESLDHFTRSAAAADDRTAILIKRV